MDMIHGDIKPQNFLVFWNDGWGRDEWRQPEITHAKLADFGYAGWNMDPSKEVSLYLPESKPWAGPEYHHRAFGIQQAKQLEIFSFGLSCLWFLFHDKLKSLDAETPVRLAEICHENAFYDAKSIERLKRDGLLSQLACELVRSETSLGGAVKQDLILFFVSSLDMDPKTRKLSIECLVTAAGYKT
jgi:serine/threonine protein kinase